MISLHISKLRKLDNWANALSFWLALSHILCTCFVKDSLLSMVTPRNFSLFIIFCFLFQNRNTSFLISCDQKMTLISARFHCVLIKSLKNFIRLNFSLFNNQINIFEANVRCCIISITCYVSWFDNKKMVAHVNIEKEWAKNWTLGTPKSGSYHVLYSLSIFARCVLPTR